MDELDLGATIRGFSPGQRVFQRYTLRKIIGRGGMGVVWLASDEKLEREVALKFLPEIVKGDRGAMEELKAETRRALGLTHSNIVRIHDFVEDATTAAIAMEYISGDTLANRRLDQPNRVFEVEDLRRWVRQLCEAIAYAHEKGKVVHRDLKPANLMLDAHGDLKVADFGIARSISDSVSRISAKAGSSGTPAYMSPQQMMGENPTPADDIYAIGATLYELLTGKPPFHSGNLIAQVQSVVPPSLAARRADLKVTGAPIPPAWERAIAACLAKEPAARPRHAAEVLALLGGGGGAAAVPVPAVPLDAPLPVAPQVGDSRWVELPGGGRLELKPIPAGEFVIGSPDDEGGRYDEEGPRRHVRLTQPFWLGRTAVTHGQWRAVMGRDLVAQVRLALEDDTEYTLDGKAQTIRASWNMGRDDDPATRVGPRGDDVVMHYVSWEDAREFCRRLNEQETAAGRVPEGYEYTLPTEAQWEYACRAGTRTATFAGPMEIRGGMNAPILDAIAWYGGNSSVRFSGGGWDTADWKEKQYPGGQAGPRNVGVKRANPWGLHDMLGNTWEWCLDRYELYPEQPGTDPIARGLLASRICRGGGWNSVARECRAACRNWGAPGLRRVAFGCRVALAPIVQEPADAVTADAVPAAPDEVTYPDSLAAGQPWRTTLRSGVGLAFRWIPPGECLLGSPEGEAGAYDEEGPRTAARISAGFWLGRTPVTHGQWRALMGTSLRDQVRRALQDNGVYPLNGKNQTIRDHWGVAAGDDPQSRIGGEEDSLPMHYVNWDDAMAFCARLTAQERAAGRLPAGYEYVLPTEAQWEYACRAGTDLATYAGPIDIFGEHNAPVLDPIAWYGGNSHVGFKGRGWSTEKWADKQHAGTGNAGPRAVATREPNAWGLHDMLGNVWEWCFDGYEKYPGGNVVDRVAAPDGVNRINRGGAWNGRARDCRCACRNWAGRHLPASHIGFRVALAPVIAAKPKPATAVAAAAPATPAGSAATASSGRRDVAILIACVLLLILAAAAAIWWQKEKRRVSAAAVPDENGRPALPLPMNEPVSVGATPATAEWTMPVPTVTRLLAPGVAAKSVNYVAVNGTDVFFSAVRANDQQAILRLELAGGEVSKVADAHNPNGVAVYDGYVYWIDPNSGPATDTQIWQAPVEANPNYPPRAIYTGSQVGEPILDGSGLAVVAPPANPTFFDLVGLAAVDQVGGTLAFLSLYTAELKVFHRNRYAGGFANEHLQSIAHDTGTGVFVVGSGKEGVTPPNIVHYSTIEEGSANVLWRGAPLVAPAAVAVGNGILFIADPGADNAIWCLSFSGGSPHRLEIPPGTFRSVRGLAVDRNGELIASDSGNGAIYRLGNLPTPDQLVFGRLANQDGVYFTPSGLGVLFRREGNGQAPGPGSRVRFTFKAMDLDGAPLSASAEGDPVEAEIGTGLALGLDEALMMLTPGGSARFLIPPSLGSVAFYHPKPERAAGVMVDVTLLP